MPRGHRGHHGRTWIIRRGRSSSHDGSDRHQQQPPNFASAAAALLALLWLAASGGPAQAQAQIPAPPRSPRPLPPPPATLPPPLDACPAAGPYPSSSAGPLSGGQDEGAAAASAASAAAASRAAASAEALAGLIEGGGVGRPTAASVWQYLERRAAGARPVPSAVLLAASAAAFFALVLWRAVARAQAAFRGCSGRQGVVGGEFVFPDEARALAVRAAAERHRARSGGCSVAARMLLTAAAAAAAAFAVLGAVRAADTRLAAPLLERADAAAGLAADVALRADDARAALLGASEAAGDLSLAVASASSAAAAASDEAATAIAAAAAAAAAAAGVPAPALPPAVAAFDDDAAASASATSDQLDQLGEGLQAAAGALERVTDSVRASLLPLLAAPPPPPPPVAPAASAEDGNGDGDGNGGGGGGVAPAVPRSRWWRLPALSVANWRPVATALDGWRRRAEIGLFAALAAAPCLLVLCAWAGWRPGVALAMSAALWLATVAALLALVLALFDVVLGDGCSAAEALAMRFCPEALRPILNYYFGGSGGGAGGASTPVALDPRGLGLAAALDASGILGPDAGPLLRQALETEAPGGASNATALLSAGALEASLGALLSPGNATALPLPSPLPTTPAATLLANATAALSGAASNLAAAADAASGELAQLLASLSRDRALGPAYASPKALVCCALPAALRGAWLALTGSVAGALAAAAAAALLLRRLDRAAAAEAAAGWGRGAGGGADGGPGGGGWRGAGSGSGGAPGGGAYGGGGGKAAARRALEARLGEIEAARHGRLRALDEAAEAEAGARRATYYGGQGPAM